jgi:diphthamide biosynthesis methyltransferase
MRVLGHRERYGVKTWLIMNYELKITSAKIVIHNSEFVITAFLTQIVMENKIGLKTLVLLGFKNDQRKFLETFAKLFFVLFFCNE